MRMYSQGNLSDAGLCKSILNGAGLNCTEEEAVAMAMGQISEYLFCVHGYHTLEGACFFNVSLSAPVTE